jgi:excisionase family DNA binding protein
VTELADYLRVSERTVYDWLNRGTVPALKVGNSWRFRKIEIDRWMEAERTGPTQFAELPSEPNRQLSGKEEKNRAKLEFEAKIAQCEREMTRLLAPGGFDSYLLQPLEDEFGADCVDKAVKNLARKKILRVEKMKSADEVGSRVIRRRE